MSLNSKNDKKRSSFADDWVPIRAIANGMIQTDDGYYVTGVKVYPKNIFIMDSGSQNNILFKLSTFYNTIDFEFWLLIADRPVDIDVYLARLQLLYNQNQNNAIKKLIMQDINKANEFMGQYNVVDTEYYILFKEKRMEQITKKIHNLISGLANVGLQSTQTSNTDLRIILDNYLNDGDTTNFGAVM